MHMFISALAAIAMFAAPQAAQGEAKPQKPAMEKVCYKVEVAGSNLPKKHCEMKPVKVAEDASDKVADTTAKPE
jgi:hypothetical protein